MKTASVFRLVAYLPVLLLTPSTSLTPDVFPMSTRAILAERSKALNPPKGSYTASGWSNRAATVLTPVQLEPTGIYTGDRPFYWNKIDVGCRMTVVELPSKTNGKTDLFIHSPVGIDGPLTKALGDIGHVKYVVSPNYEHLKFATQWHQSFPEAEMWGCPGLGQRLPEIEWKGEIPFHCRPVGWRRVKGVMGNDDIVPWDNLEIQSLHIDIEKNPFTGTPFFNEVIFYHSASKTLMCTDLFWNYPADTVPNSQYGVDDTWELAPKVEKIPIGSILWKAGMDKIYYPFFNNFMVTDPAAYKDIANHIVNVWDVETVIPAHGDILRGKDFIRKVFTEYFQIN